VGQLGEDLVLLTLGACRGSLSQAYGISYALMGAELVELAARDQADITGGRIVVTDPAPTGDPELDAALASLAESAEPPLAQEWVGRPGCGSLAATWTGSKPPGG
jgi:Golgi phosphoprotein 3 (GPP34)